MGNNKEKFTFASPVNYLKIYRALSSCFHSVDCNRSDMLPIDKF